MKTNILKYSLPLMLMAFLFSCTDQLEDINFDQKAVYKDDLKADNVIFQAFQPGMSKGIYRLEASWMHQVQYNLNADHFASYFMSANNFTSNNATYQLRDDWNSWPITVGYGDVLNPFLLARQETIEEAPDFYGIALILKVWTGHRLIDQFGPMPYSKLGEQDDPDFDTEEEAYKLFFAELDTAVAALDAALAIGKEAPYFKDPSTYQGSFALWVKMANTLRLRLAMRVSGVDEELSKTQASKAVTHPLGVIKTGEDFLVKSDLGHPLSFVSAWGDAQMSADVESILGGYNDPRLAIHYTLAQDATENVNGKFRGIRQGIQTPEKGHYVDYSRPATAPSAPAALMPAAEAYFLLAEAELKGYGLGQGSVSELYEAGIAASFAQHGLSGVGEYLSSEATPKDYIDYKTPDGEDYNFNATTDITPAWKEADSEERKLERIITQKWIALMPEGMEAWSELRRTGYPKLKPVPNNKNESIPEGEFIKRLPYPTSLVGTNPGGVEGAIEHLGGNNANIKLWWDTK